MLSFANFGGIFILPDEGDKRVPFPEAGTMPGRGGVVEQTVFGARESKIRIHVLIGKPCLLSTCPSSSSLILSPWELFYNSVHDQDEAYKFYPAGCVLLTSVSLCF